LNFCQAATALAGGRRAGEAKKPEGIDLQMDKSNEISGKQDGMQDDDEQ
jgi:hypothetical protein